MTRIQRAISILIFWSFCAASAVSIERFPPPEFETDYTMNQTTTPMPHVEWMEAADVGVLFTALIAGSWLVLKKRSRKGIFGLMLFSLLYFGFWRKGCICSIGAIGNIALGIFNAEYAIPWFVVAFFFLPLVFTLFFGRTFCAGVCPLGAIQDVVLLNPVRVPHWLEATLRLLAWLYLSLAVLFAATASAFIICRYDPFIAFFRFDANPAMWVMSLSMLVIAVFVGRPYCRFLCPYGLILRQIGRVSRYRVTVTPDECIHCRLCEDACPFGAIDKPTVDWPQKEHTKGKRRLLLLILCLPVFIAVGTLLGLKLHHRMALLHPDVNLVKCLRLDQAGVTDKNIQDVCKAFYGSGQSLEQLNQRAAAKQKQFALGSSIVGGWMGLVAGLSLIQYSIFWKRDEYQAQRTGCVACGRCYNACPQHRIWLKNKSAVKRNES